MIRHLGSRNGRSQMTSASVVESRTPSIVRTTAFVVMNSGIIHTQGIMSDYFGDGREERLDAVEFESELRARKQAREQQSYYHETHVNPMFWFGFRDQVMRELVTALRGRGRNVRILPPREAAIALLAND